MNAIATEVEMNWTDDIATMIAGATGVMSSVIAFIAGQRTAKRAETDNTGAELENVGKAITIWQDTAVKLVDDISNLNSKLASVVNELTALRHLHDECERAKNVLSGRVKDLESAVCLIQTKAE
jgi:septal ring factor EnvC (AmiA/AmiB activator)